MRTALVTGAAGFIGFHLSRLLLDQGWRVVGVDSHNDYYDPALKAAREARLTGPAYRAVRGTIETPGLLAGLMAEERPEAVIHLAAQAGVPLGPGGEELLASAATSHSADLQQRALELRALLACAPSRPASDA